jgi:hypothetical protein
MVSRPGQIAHPQDVANVVGFLVTSLTQHSTGFAIEVGSGSSL